MLWVFAFFLSSYGMLHAYIFLKVQLAFRLPIGATAALAVFLLLMIFSVFFIRMLERADHVTAARLLGILGYSWIALIFWFCCLSLSADIWNFVARAASRVLPAAGSLLLPPRPTFVAIWILVILTAGIGLIGANRISVREIQIQSPLLPKGAKPIQIAQIADLHFSIHRGPRLLRQVIDKLNEIKPDVIVSTGDMVDSDFRNIEDLARELAKLKPPLGKYAVLGNHEYYWKESASLAFHQLAGFRLLRQDTVLLTPTIVLAGVDDPAGHYTHQNCFDDEYKTFDKAPHDAFIILLKHQPRVREESIGRFDIQLSGHVHDGQVFPFQLVVRFLYPYLGGTYRLGPRSLLNVSRGIGTWGPPMRLGARPEICVITLVPAATQSGG